MGYVIGSLNARHFSGLGTHDIGKIAEIILGEGFDVVALQEVKRREAISFLLQRLPGWEGAYGKSPRDSDVGKGQDTDGGGLGFGYVWNTKRLRECSKDGQPAIIEEIRSKIEITRRPFYGRFTPSGLGGPFCEFRLINIHLWHGKNYMAETPKRLEEFMLVTQDIYRWLENRRYGNNMQAFTVVLGDYNFNAVISQGHESDSAKYFIKTVQEDATTLSVKDGRLAKSYDHFSYNALRFQETGIHWERIDTVAKYMGNDYERHWREVSDHVPIKLELDLNYRR